MKWSGKPCIWRPWATKDHSILSKALARSNLSIKPFCFPVESWKEWAIRRSETVHSVPKHLFCNNFRADCCEILQKTPKHHFSSIRDNWVCSYENYADLVFCGERGVWHGDLRRETNTPRSIEYENIWHLLQKVETLGFIWRVYKLSIKYENYEAYAY